MDNKTNSLSNLLDDQFNDIITISKKPNILISRGANEWIQLARKIPNPESLFGSIWHEGEVAILFSNTGKGKSILGVQIADGISKGNSIISLETIKKSVMYFDFELSAKPFQQRYTDENEVSYDFNEEFIRVEIDHSKILDVGDKSFEETVILSIKDLVDKSNATVLLIDNITFLSAANEKSKEALALMKIILELSRKRNLAILLIAHTPKRDIFKPIQLEDLAGSKALSNFADAVFCIGESIKGSNVRYIKQLKNRNYPVEFHEKNVIECKVVKENSFLQLKFSEFNSEHNHLTKTNEESEDRIDEIMHFKNQSLSNVEIGRRLGVSEAAIRRRIEKFKKSNQ